METSATEAFCALIWHYYEQNKRAMPWRDTNDPYHILVSEFMLQQTQVSRVIPKFIEFVDRFPTIAALAEVPLSEVIGVWSGLGYNRRAQFLHKSAQMIHMEHRNVIPKDIDELVKLPGIGPNTAGAIVAYAFNKPVVYIETNIRSVFLHHFFHDKTEVSDADILPLIEATLDTNNPREWYWALMDYGAHLKSTLPNPSRKSKHHTKQSPFQGSVRQIRGKVLKTLIQGPHTIGTLHEQIADTRLRSVIDTLVREGVVMQENDMLRLSD